jgi:phosphatidylglycerol:prolipoprotein diacylglycerol transferase
MLAAIPYINLEVYNLPIPGLGNLPIDPWFTLVCIGFVVGLEVARHRGTKLGLDVRDIVDGAVFIVLMGFFIGHVFTVVLYHPERLSEDGIWSILRVWEGFSSMGGFVGAILGAILFYKVIRKRDGWRHADVITFGFPFGWVFGRLGCSVVHDHVGSLTKFPLGMYFPEDSLRLATGGYAPAGVRHELGLYEALYTVGICVLFYFLGRKDRPPRFFLAVFAMTYAPIRFLLDFLRNTDLYYQDARYFGLTPGHYSALAMFVAGLVLWWTIDSRSFRPWPMDGQPDQARRATGEADD